MRYFLRERLFSIGGDAMIQDQHGKDVYFVDGKAISLGRRLEIKDLQGKVLAVIQQTLLSLAPAFDIQNRVGESAHVALKLLSLRDRLKIDVPGSNDLEAVGDLLHHEYKISRRGREVARVSKRWLTITDSYGIEIDDEEDQILLLSGAVVIDEILDIRKRADES